jgi:SAM-dependent methyltransferase
MRAKIRRALNNYYEREAFVAAELSKVSGRILDAGCGSQTYRRFCEHLDYRAQDFGKFTGDERRGLTALDSYEYGKLDYISNIWSIPEQDGYFDTILCTEVLEHIPYPIETIREFSRLLKPGGTLILTAPSNCLRHMDPYFFYSGFSDRFFERVLPDCGLEITRLEAVGDYYSWLAVEMARTAATHSMLSKLILAPAFLYYFLKRKSSTSVHALCMGYHVVAQKKQVRYPQANGLSDRS